MPFNNKGDTFSFPILYLESNIYFASLGSPLLFAFELFCLVKHLSSRTMKNTQHWGMNFFLM